MMTAEQHNRSRQLRDLVGPWLHLDDSQDRAISGLCDDSRYVAPGDLFIARQGTQSDGRSFIDDAIARGCAAVLVEGDAAVMEREGVPVLTIGALDSAVGLIAERYYGYPGNELWTVGVTGTNGKSSVAHYIAEALHRADAGEKFAFVGTIGTGYPGQLEGTANTTPGALLLHRLLADYRDREAAGVVMETSSHGLAQQRVAGVPFDVAVFTNLSRDHLDYHADMESYGAAKRRLFECRSLKFAVVNIDDAFAPALCEAIPDEALAIRYSASGNREADIYATHVETSARGLALDVDGLFGQAHIESELFARFNADNLLAALGVLLARELRLDDAAARLSRVGPVPGRMQRFTGNGGPTVIVDYAHTPDALEQVLKNLAMHGNGALWCVFGCGGDRDAGKRPAMGAVAERYSRQVILTDDNPRNEDPIDIIADIQAGMQDADAALVINDRSEAIRHALRCARVGDVVLVAGKGHEDYQERGNVRRPYSDVDTVRALLAEVWP